MKVLVVDGENLSIEDVINVARNRQRVKLSKKAEDAIKKSRAVVDKLVAQNKVVYGVTTGFGSLANVSISKDDTEKLQENLIRSHACGVGKALDENVVRATMLLRINTFAKGCSGIRLSTVNTLIKMLNKQLYPYMPEKGSVGASGDLAPLSHLALVVIGEGEAFVNGKRISGKEAMKKAGISPVRLTSKEGLALNNGTAVMTAIASLAIYDSEKLMKNAHIAAAMTFEALKANSNALDKNVHNSRPHPGQIKSAELLRKILHGSGLVDSNKEKVQDAYSIRAAPVVLGSSWEAINYVKRKVEIEINSATDNPLIFGDEAYSAANFHGQPIALAMDFLGMALAEIGVISERRISRMIDPKLNEGLPAFLIEDSGLNNGFMIPQYIAAALVSENKVLAHPASVDSIPTCANQEDHVSMGTIAARKAREILKNVEHIVVIELLTASQALDFRKSNPSPTINKVHGKIREEIPHVKKDVVLYKLMQKMHRLVVSGRLL